MKKKKQYLWYFNPKKLPNELHEKAVFALTHLFFLKKKKRLHQLENISMFLKRATLVK